MFSFLLTGKSRTLTAHGIHKKWNSVDEALSSDTSSLIVGALPFHPSDKPALFTPEYHKFSTTPPLLAQEAPPQAIGTKEVPSREEHAERVKETISEIRKGRFDKLVLAREVRYYLDAPLSPKSLLARYIAGSSTGDGHLVDLSPAGSEHDGSFLVGSSPELLIAKKGDEVFSYPLAGTILKVEDPELNRLRASELLHSKKDVEEHGYVTTEIQRILNPYCSELEVPDHPTLFETSHTIHLGTPIRGKLKNTQVSVLDLAAALHPTPAVCGYPTAETQQALLELEPDRGFYAGAVGWADGNGDGEWRVTIRSAVLQGQVARAHAGGGIVADSQPLGEVNETSAKLGPIRAALGLPREESETQTPEFAQAH